VVSIVFLYKKNRFFGVMNSFLASSAVDCQFELQLHQTKTIKLVFVVYHVENKLNFNEMMMGFTLY
jgi:hypothetical protein